jgi:hypothetical protein
MNTHNEIGATVVKDAIKIGDTIYISVPLKEGDRLIINGWEVTLPKDEHGN